MCKCVNTSESECKSESKIKSTRAQDRREIKRRHLKQREAIMINKESTSLQGGPEPEHKEVADPVRLASSPIKLTNTQKGVGSLKITDGICLVFALIVVVLLGLHFGFGN